MLQKMAKIKMVLGDSTNGDKGPGHEAIASRIYTALIGEAPPGGTFQGDHWMDVGFQGTNPSTDLRAAGMLAMLQLLYLVTQHRHFARCMLALSNDSAQHFPFATVSINVTAMALRALRSRPCHPLLVEQCSTNADQSINAQCLDVINRLYAGIMFELYTEWVHEKHTVVAFQAVSEALEARAVKNPEWFFSIDPTIQNGDGSAVSGGFNGVC